MKMHKKSQSSMEFFTLVGLAFLTTILFVAITVNEVKEFSDQKEFLMIKDLSLRLQKEVAIASSVEDGYERSFTLQSKLENIVDYTLSTTNNNSITVNSPKTSFSVRIQPVVGYFIKANNKIEKINGVVYINRGLIQCSDGFDNDGDTKVDLSDLGCASETDNDESDEITDWYNAGWQFRKKITIDSAMVGGDLIDFPVLISFIDADLRDDAQDDGDDILFTLSDKITKLSHDVEKFDGASGELAAWVKVPSISSSVDTVIYMYYWNPSVASQENKADVWSNGYEAVYHLHDDFLDSAKNHDGTNSGSADIIGKIGDGQDFTPQSYINFGTWSVSGQQITIQAWANFDDFNQDDPRIITKSISGSIQDHVFMLSLKDPSGIHNEKYLRSRIKTGTSDSSGTNTLVSDINPLDARTWHLAAATYDGADMKLYKDGGNEVATAPWSGNLRENNWEIWAGHNPGGSFTQYSLDGKLDEIRISSVARSPNWLTTEYNNQNSPSAFYSVGPEETQT